MENELPKGWKEVPLFDISFISFCVSKNLLTINNLKIKEKYHEINKR